MQAHKITIECTADGWSVKVLSDSGAALWQDDHRMVSAHESVGLKADNDPTEDQIGDGFDYIADALDGVGFTPFDLSQALLMAREEAEA